MTRYFGWCCRALALALVAAAPAQAVNPALFSGMRWRFVGPYRGGRVSAVTGAASQPNLYYIGTPGGGVFQTTDGGVVWRPVFDAPGADSIGAVALAPSDPNIVYAGTGEQLPGNGMWGTRDGGRTWRHLGLADARHLDALLVSPRDPQWVIAAAGPGDDAGGAYVSRDGGASWQRTLTPAHRGGVVNLAAAPDDAGDLYAATQSAASGAGRGGRGGAGGAPAPIFRSRDGGLTWTQCAGDGLPSSGRGKMGLAVAPGSRGEHLYAYLSAGLYVSDDGGANWRRSTSDPRITGGGYFCQVYVDPNHANVIYAVETAFYRSTDGGATFTAFKGAPGGDDYHVLWIDPADSGRMLLGVDQGATATVDGGRSWSSWFNQPTAQLYRVSVGGSYPHYLFTSQQDSGGTLALPVRSNYGRIAPQDWYSTGGNENAFSAPDPLHPDFVYVNGWYGNVVRFDRRNGVVTTVFAAGARYRLASPAPIVFSPADPHRLYVGTQYLLASDDGGATWLQLGPDLTGGAPAAAGGRGRLGRGAAITSIAPSPWGAALWVGTSNGRVLLSRDAGQQWQTVLSVPGAVRMVEAAQWPADAASGQATSQATACAVLAAPRTPAIECTSDFGAHWRAAVAGLSAAAGVWAVRSDTRQPGLLFAALDSGVEVSFDAGGNWQPLQLNLPPSPVRDVAEAGDDLAAATYGRGMWVLDDLTPLRHMAAAADAAAQGQAYLYPPPITLRVRNDNDQDMPLPAEVPAADNPPAGAIIDYYLPQAAAQPLRLDIYDPAGQLVRSFSSAPPLPAIPPVLYSVAADWFAPRSQLPNHAGDNRFSWNLRTADPKVWWPRGFRSFEVGDDATPGRTPLQEPEGYLLGVGDYQVRLTVDGARYQRTLHVVPDPRARHAPNPALGQLEAAVDTGLAASYDGAQAAHDAHDAAAERTFADLNRTLVAYFSAITSGDGPPSPEIVGLWGAPAGSAGYCSQLQQAAAGWQAQHPGAPPLHAPACLQLGPSPAASAHHR